MTLGQSEKRTLRAEAAILCPQICGGSRVRNKYTDAALYLLNQHGVLCTQARDLFSAGSVALRADNTRGGIYIMRALRDIEDLMRDAANRLDGALFEEYWGQDYPVNGTNTGVATESGRLRAGLDSFGIVVRWVVGGLGRYRLLFAREPNVNGWNGGDSEGVGGV